MNIRYLFCIYIFGLFCAACVDDKNYNPRLPDKPDEEIKDYAMPLDSNKIFVHPGCMVSRADLDRAKANLGEEPWKSAFEALQEAEWFNDTDFPRTANLLEHNDSLYLLRGTEDEKYLIPEFKEEAEWGKGNYEDQYKDCSAAWSNAVYWKLTGNTAAADKAVSVLNAWAKECVGIVGDNNASLAVMESGFAFASIAELLRDYDGWNAPDQAAFKQWLVRLHVDKLLDFLERHRGNVYTYHWSSWDLGHMAALMAIGIYCDRADLYNRAIDYITYGKGNGNFRNFIRVIHPAISGEDDIDLGQTQESGRDQENNLYSIQLGAAICRMAWNQGDDLYGYDNNRFLKGAEYAAKYNYGPEIEAHESIRLTYPFMPLFQNASGDFADTFGAKGRGSIAYGFLSIYEHYRKHKGLDTRFLRWAAKTPVTDGKHLPEPGKVLVEGETFHGDHGAGFGHGTLLFTED